MSTDERERLLGRADAIETWAARLELRGMDASKEWDEVARLRAEAELARPPAPAAAWGFALVAAVVTAVVWLVDVVMPRSKREG